MPDPLLHGFSAPIGCTTAEGWLFLAAPKPREWDALAPPGTRGRHAFRHRDGAGGRRRRARRRARRRLSARARRPNGARFVAADVAGVEVASGPMPRVVIEEPWYREAGFRRRRASDAWAARAAWRRW
jgi:hypothetical protein